MKLKDFLLLVQGDDSRIILLSNSDDIRTTLEGDPFTLERCLKNDILEADIVAIEPYNCGSMQVRI